MRGGSLRRVIAATGAAVLIACQAAPQEREPALGAKPCGDTAFERSFCMVELMMDDVRKSYGGRGAGGGIARIVGTTSTSYTIALSQEERTDLLTYEFAVEQGRVRIVSVTPGVRSY